MERQTHSTTSERSVDPAEWLDLYGNYLFRYAFQRTRSRELAEDLVQDTLLSAHKAYDSFEGKASVKTWLVSILRNKIIDNARRAKRIEFVSLDSYAEDEGSDDPFNRFGLWKRILERWDATPADLMESKDFIKQVRLCLSGLPDGMQQVFSLKVVDQLDTKEICDMLDLKENNVWVILHRARLKMQQCLHANWFTE